MKDIDPFARENYSGKAKIRLSHFIQNHKIILVKPSWDQTHLPRDID